ANRAFWSFLNSDEPVLGRSFADILHAGDVAAIAGCEVCRARREGREGTFEINSSGLPPPWAGRYLRVTLSRVEDASIGFVGMIDVIRDMPELRAAEAAVASRQAILESVLSCTGDAMTLFDLNLRIVWANPAAERLSGIAAEQLRGVEVLRFVTGTERND